MTSIKSGNDIIIMNDLDCMKHAYSLALKGAGKTSPNPMVGAVIVKGKKIIAEGWHKRCTTSHAEIIALKKAGKAAKGTKLYVTLEPCFHYGRTAPCVDEVIAGGIKHVIIGMKDPNPLTCGKSIARLRRAGIKVKVGCLESEILKLNEVFIKYITKKMPFVVTKTAQTLDGKIATANGSSKWITSENSRKFARKLRDNFDAILVGANTVIADDPKLTGLRKDKRLKRIVLDSSLRISLNARLFKNTRLSDCIIAVTQKASKKKVEQFANKGIQVIVCPARDGRVSLRPLLKRLAKQEITSVLIEGGSRVVGSALNEKVVDKMNVYVAPKILGDDKALGSVSGRKVSAINETIRLKDICLKRIGDDFFIEGRVVY